MEIPHLNFLISEIDYESGVYKVLEAIKPEWGKRDVRFKIFSAGITNKLIGAFNTTQKPSQIILIRINGNQTDLLINRQAEILNMKFLHANNLAPKIFASFENGICYEFINGVTLNPSMVREEKIWKLVAVEMAKMHKLKLSEQQKEMEPMIKNKAEKYLSLIPEKFSNWEKGERISSFIPPKSELISEFSTLYSTLSSLNSPLVFCHNDLLLGNIIFNEKSQKISFIDFEYAEPNHQAFDIGNHFAKIAGAASSKGINYENYPNKEFQLKWLRVYWEEFSGGDLSEGKLEELYKAVNKFALSGHFLWTCWSLIQAEFSTIDFDFVGLAIIYYTEYLRRKAEFLNL